MSKFISLYILFIINILLTKQKLCGRNEIENCIECDLENEKCSKCEDKYFALFADLKCISCSDSKYGQLGCEGNCDGSRYNETHFPLCDKCKEGYYNEKGLCIQCSIESPYCVKCSPGSGDKRLKCLECVGGLNGEYRVQNDWKCHPCKISNCYDAHYIKGTENDCKCSICNPGYYLYNDACKKCEYQTEEIKGGKCRKYYCPDVKENNCKCGSDYVLTKQNTCTPCPNYCKSCYYDSFAKSAKCSECISKYSLKNPNTCAPCPSNCKSCYYDSNANLVRCRKCNGNYTLTPQNTACAPCPDYCISCYYDENTNSIKCLECISQYAITAQNTACSPCPDYCISCYYDENTNSTKCLECISQYAITAQNISCEHCPDFCSSCFYDENTDSIKCDNCISNYGLTDQKLCSCCPEHCRACSYDENENKLKCISCLSKYFLNSKKECVSCQKGCNICKIEDGDLICTSCDDLYVLEDNKCFKLNIPQPCDKYTNKRFNKSDEALCTRCWDRATLDKTNNKCKSCPGYCSSCYFDEDNRFICNICDPDSVLNKSKICEKCSENEEIGGEGCIHCKYEYEKNKCTDCRDDYIHIDNDNVCKLPSEVNLSVGCQNATRLDRNGGYTCNRCRKGKYTLITKYNKIKDCYRAEFELINCEEGTEDINKNLNCTKCIYNYRFIWSELIQRIVCDYRCASDYFFNYDLDIRGCYKCDDEKGGGQIGCDSKKGCSFNAADNRLYCNVCKPGYFLYDGECLPCSKIDDNCTECDFNNTENKFICNKCKDNTFYINETDLCNLITYDEYPEVTAGCILPNYNYTIYIENNKCFDCKDGFFKTKEESCIYCKARKNGGPKCDECQYIKDRYGIETNRINCKICQNDNILSPIGRKCYNCEDEVGPGCESCIFENETERVICEKCKEGYEINGEGYCTSKYSYDILVPNCLIYDNNDSISKRLLAAAVKCKKCNDGYYVNNRGKCAILSLEMCSLNSMFNFGRSIYDECKIFCEMMYYPIVDYKENNETIENILKNNINNSYDSLKTKIKDIIEDGKFCINNIDENNGLRKCIKIEYDSNSKNYKCLKCINGYQLDKSNNSCLLNTEIGKKNITKRECNSEEILIKAENDTYCEKPIGELEGCSNGTIADTKYINTRYNCVNCIDNYEPIFSHYFDRIICVGAISPPIENVKKLSSDAYKGIDKDTDIENGKCKIEKTFTPDGENCYLCNNKIVGMPGCNGTCTYSLKRINILECKGDCIQGYLETSKGVCESCDVINKGCLNCEYKKDYPDGYSDIKRQNRFECIECDEGYQLAKDGNCHHCSEFGFAYCDKCIKNKDNNDLECIKCIDGYFLTTNGYCTKCEAPKVQGTQNKCIFCNNTEEGGLEGCELCSSDNGNIICQQCKKGFILSEDDKTCIKISGSSDLEQLTNCQKVSRNNSENYICTKCYENYNDLYDKNRKEKICVNNEFLLTPKPNTLKYCKNSINMGTEDQPKHSCEKCIENDILTQEQREQGVTFTKITFPENETSYCDISSNYVVMENCSEARRIIDEEGNVLYNCTKCVDDNKYVYKVDLDLRICTYFFYSRYCMVKNCKTCKYGNNYFCSQCLLDNYEVNPASGSCVKKVPKAPAISWKDMFRLSLNSKTQLNSQDLYGFSIYLRGISSNHFPTGHAFLINLIFDVLYNRNLRNIEENDVESREMKIPTYCQIVEHTDEVKNKINLIDYFCFANRTGEDEIRESQIKLAKIELSHDDNKDNTEFLENSNFEDMISELNLDELKDKNISSFTLKMFDNITVFEMDEVFDQKSENYTFDFIIYGKINKELEPDTIKTKFKLRRIKDAFADCEFNIGENQTADLKCHADLEGYKENEVFKFKTIEFQYKESSIYLNRLNEINLIHEKKEKKLNTLTIIIIVIAIILLILITIFIIILIRKLSKKKIVIEQTDLYNTKYGLTEKPKAKKRSIKNKGNYKPAMQTTQTTETNSKKRSIKNRKEPEELPPQNFKDDVKLYNKNALK